MEEPFELKSLRVIAETRTTFLVHRGLIKALIVELRVVSLYINDMNSTSVGYNPNNGKGATPTSCGDGVDRCVPVQGPEIRGQFTPSGHEIA